MAKSKGFKSARCWCCNNERPVQGHHVIPREYGGPDDGELVDICGDCHNTLHLEATFYYKNNRFKILDRTLPWQNGDTNSHAFRIRRLIAAVVRSRKLFDAGMVDSGEQRRMTQISWDSDEELRIAHDLKERLGFTSLPRAIKHVVFEHWKKLQR